MESSLYDAEVRNKAKRGEAKQCMYCPKMHYKDAMESHYRSKHYDCFAWVHCDLCNGKQKDVRYVCFLLGPLLF